MSISYVLLPVTRLLGQRSCRNTPYSELDATGIEQKLRESMGARTHATSADTVRLSSSCARAYGDRDFGPSARLAVTCNFSLPYGYISMQLIEGVDSRAGTRPVLSVMIERK